MEESSAEELPSELPLLAMVSGPGAKPENEQLLLYGWHLLFGQPPVLSHRSMSRH